MLGFKLGPLVGVLRASRKGGGEGVSPHSGDFLAPGSGSAGRNGKADEPYTRIFGLRVPYNCGG